jgi:hypothetical protein
VVRRKKKKLSKKYYGTSHMVSKDEAKFIFERGASSSFLARARRAMSSYRRKLRPMAEAKEAYKVETFAHKVGVTRQVVVNDLGAFADLSRRMGQAAAETEAKTICREPAAVMACGRAASWSMSIARAIRVSAAFSTPTTRN